ncbi:MAG TPA: S8 family peptidase [Micromonosporaceae bacterium]
MATALVIMLAGPAQANQTGPGIAGSNPSRSASSGTNTSEPTIVTAEGTTVADSYIVVLKPTSQLRTRGVSATAAELVRRHGGTVGPVYRHALTGFEVGASAAVARRLAADPAVAYVEQNSVMTVNGTQSPTPSWGLDRIDQRYLPLDNSYTYPTTAAGVRAYLIDTGIRLTHSDFGGRAVSGFDAVDGGTADDCNGHGTHLAGIVGGATYGVAKGATLVAVRVLNCTGSGTTAQVISGVDWVTGDHDPGELAVANLSLGGSVNTSLETAVRNSIADGVTYSVAAGGSGSDACNYSPARVSEAITVGATDSRDNRTSSSNIGTCLDLFAPGAGITSTWYTTDSATATLSGTSMATAHVTGAAALALARNPSFTPQQVRDYLVDTATIGVVLNAGTGSPNRLLFVVNDSGCANLGQKLANPGFESGTTGWFSTAGVIGQWAGSGKPAHTGTWTAWLGGNGVASTEQLYQTVAVPAGCTTYLFAFWLAIDTAETSTTTAYDRLWVQVLNSTGAVLATLATYSNLNAGTGYQVRTFNLAPWAGQTIRLRWFEQEDAGQQTSFVVDDTALYVT